MDSISSREREGLTIAALFKLRRKGSAWIVPSQTRDRSWYTVCLGAAEPTCSCADHQDLGNVCKHIHAAKIAMQRENQDDDEPIELPEPDAVPLKKERPAYPQRWAAYNRAQTGEKTQFQLLLRSLCDGLPSPPSGRGRPRIPLGDAIFSAIFKVYSTVSGRRFMSDLNDAHEKGLVGRVPCYNSIFNCFEDPATLPILKQLVEVTAKPLAGVETNFAVDSSGFSGCRFDRWYDHKFGDRRIRRAWCKVHAMVGVRTNIVTSIEILDQHASDPMQFPTLLAATAKNFQINEVSADMAYSTKAIHRAVDELGATALIPFKRTASATGKDELWNKAFHYFQLNREEFLSRYHQRSNVESTFAMIKAKFGDSVRSKCDVAMANEVAAKFVAHNICVLIQSMHEMGVSPVLWAGVRELPSGALAN